MGFFDFLKRQQRTQPESQPIVQLWTQEWERRQGKALPRNFQAELEVYSRHTWPYACAKIVAQALTTVPLRFYRGEQEIAAGPLREIFDYVNNYQTLETLLFITSLDLQFCGNAYWHLGTVDGPAAKLERIPPWRVKAKPGNDQRIEAWLLDTGPQATRLEFGEVLHFLQPDPANELYGVGAAASGALAIDTDQAAGETNKDMLERDIRPRGILTVKKRIQTAEERRAIAKRFEDEHGGHGPSKGVLVVDAEESSFEATQFTLRDMEFSILRRMSRGEIAAVFSVPPPLIGIYEGGSLTTTLVDAALRLLWSLTIPPHAGCIAGTLTEFLLPRYGADLYAEFDYSEVEALQDSNLEDRRVALEEVKLNILEPGEYRTLWYPDLPPLKLKSAPPPLKQPLSPEEEDGQEAMSLAGDAAPLAGRAARRFGGASTPPPGNGKYPSGPSSKSLSEKVPH